MVLERKGLQRKLAVLLLGGTAPAVYAIPGRPGRNGLHRQRAQRGVGLRPHQYPGQAPKGGGPGHTGQTGCGHNLVQQRIMKMTPDELVRFNEAVQAQPAGGESVIGVVLFVLVLLIILDLFGATDVFPAIKPIK